VLGNEIYYFDSPHLADVKATRNYFKFFGQFRFNEKSDLKTTLIYSFFKRTGSDPPAQNENGVDPYSAVPKFNKSTFSVSTTNRFANEKLTSVTGLKFHLLSASQSFTLDSDEEIKASGNYLGAWQVVRYSLQQNLLFTGSYEYAFRLPDENELFGDVVLISSNIDLKPEKSHNLNVGTIWSFNTKSNLSLNTFYRGIKDIIFLGFPIHGARYTNVFNTRSYGAEMEGKTELFGKPTSTRQSMKMIINETVKLINGQKVWGYAIAHANNQAGADWYANEMEQITGQKPKFISSASPVLGAHVGPGVVGLAVLLE